MTTLQAALLALIETRQGMIDRRYLAAQVRMMFEHPDKARYLLAQDELKHYAKLLEN